MCRNVAAALGVAVVRMNIKGNTKDGIGRLGLGEAIAIHAAALVRSA
jgi:2C-methyl-D-erythritol 2,4-cyclodiphosphate synthase